MDPCGCGHREYLFAGLIVLPNELAGPGVTPRNFDRIETGMTLVEVEEILGGPPGFIAPNGRSWIGLALMCVTMNYSREVWAGDDGAVTLEFNVHGRVEVKTWTESPDSLREKLRQWIPWR